MENASIWISLAALAVSFFALIHSIFNSSSQRELEIVGERSDLLTRIVELKLEYEQEIRHLSWLVDVAYKLELPNANEMTKIIVSYKEFVSLTQKHYDELRAIPKVTKTKLLEMGHHIDSLRARVKTETERAKELNEFIQKQLERVYKQGHS